MDAHSTSQGGGAPAGAAAGPEAHSDRVGGNGAGGPSAPSPADAFREAAARLAEAREYAAYLVAAKLDAVKTSARTLAIYAVLGMVGLVAGAAIVVTAAALLIVGVAHGLGALFGGRMWLGDLVAGLLVLGGIAGGAIVGLKYLTKTFKAQLVAKYAERQRQQRSRFGHDVAERAVQQRAEAWAGRQSLGK